MDDSKLLSAFQELTRPVPVAEVRPRMVFDVCQPGVVLRVVLFVEAAAGVAALFVVRGQREGERERLVREANELGGSVLGEQVAGASVALVRRRLEEALRP